jgi:hypothetical protein
MSQITSLGYLCLFQMYKSIIINHLKAFSGHAFQMMDIGGGEDIEIIGKTGQVGQGGHH